MNAKPMSRFMSGSLMIVFASAGLTLSTPAVAQAVDASAARLLFTQNNCAMCHHPTRSMMGSSLRAMAGVYKAKANPEQEIIKSMTTPKKVRLADGSQEDHKVIDSKDPRALSNLARWILSH